MKGSDIHRASTWGAILIAALCFAVCGALLVFAGCSPAVVPGPVPPGPEPSPAGTPCEQAAARYVELRCGTASAEWFADQCANFGDLPGASGWNPKCMARAVDCPALSACRGGT